MLSTCGLSKHARLGLPTERRAAGARSGRCVIRDPGRAGQRARHVHQGLRTCVGRRVLRNDSEHLRAVVERAGKPGIDAAASEAGVASLYAHVPFRQDTVPVDRRRTNANWSKAFRDAMLAQDWEDRSGSPDPDPGRRTCSTCAWTTWAGTVWPTWPSWPPEWPPPRRADRARLDRAREDRGRAGTAGWPQVVNSVNYEGGRLSS
jgi:hypothetical protein